MQTHFSPLACIKITPWALLLSGAERKVTPSLVFTYLHGLYEQRHYVASRQLGRDTDFI
jgi:hypothetical protein